MPTTETKKKCWNCEEFIHPSAARCPYCNAAPKNTSNTEDASVTLSPPFRFVTTSSDNGTPMSPYTSPFTKEGEPRPMRQEPPVTPDTPTATAAATNTAANSTNLITALALMLGGSVLFLFGLVLFFYSSKGVFTLHWNAHYWPYYLVTALALLAFGWRSMNNLEKE